MKILVLEPGKKLEVREIKGDLASLQEVVGGYIERVPISARGVNLICNEEGLLLGLEPNIMGLVGTIFWVGDDGEDFCSLTDKQIDAIKLAVELLEQGIYS